MLFLAGQCTTQLIGSNPPLFEHQQAQRNPCRCGARASDWPLRSRTAASRSARLCRPASRSSRLRRAACSGCATTAAIRCGTAGSSSFRAVGRVSPGRFQCRPQFVSRGLSRRSALPAPRARLPAQNCAGESELSHSACLEEASNCLQRSRGSATSVTRRPKFPFTSTTSPRATILSPRSGPPGLRCGGQAAPHLGPSSEARRGESRGSQSAASLPAPHRAEGRCRGHAEPCPCPVCSAGAFSPAFAALLPPDSDFAADLAAGARLALQPVLLRALPPDPRPASLPPETSSRTSSVHVPAVFNWKAREIFPSPAVSSTAATLTFFPVFTSNSPAADSTTSRSSSPQAVFWSTPSPSRGVFQNPRVEDHAKRPSSSPAIVAAKPKAPASSGLGSDSKTRVLPPAPASAALKPPQSSSPEMSSCAFSPHAAFHARRPPCALPYRLSRCQRLPAHAPLRHRIAGQIEANHHPRLERFDGPERYPHRRQLQRGTEGNPPRRAFIRSRTSGA